MLRHRWEPVGKELRFRQRLRQTLILRILTWNRLADDNPLRHLSPGPQPFLAAMRMMNRMMDFTSTRPGLLAGLLIFACLGDSELRGELHDSPLRQHPLSPSEALLEFELAPGFRIELVASEPAVIDPVSIRFDHLGRMWVVEMRDYPDGPLEPGNYQGCIKILVDQDRDGFFETSHTFAESLVFPTGIQPFGDGVITTLAGEITYLADTDGDFKCDKKEVWFTGFSQDNEQLRANHPTWTLDNQVHVASGLRGGEIQAHAARWSMEAKPVSIVSRDFLFSPFGPSWQAVAGNSQFGYFQDECGRNYICSNRNPCDLLLADTGDVIENPLLPISSWVVPIMPAAEKSQVFPRVNAWTTSNLHSGQFTAACGVFRYQSDLLSVQMGNDFLACEPTGSLVQRYRTTLEGIYPETMRDREGADFIASRDPWFRPVDLVDGPDGALYVVDMHRAVIEHPAWMPEELQQRVDMRWGNTSGRIYRVVGSESTPSTQPVDSLASVTLVELVAHLSSPNRWLRSTAGRLIAERLDRAKHSTIPLEYEAEKSRLEQALRSLFESALQDRTPYGASRALWQLEWIGAIRFSDLEKAVASGRDDVCVQGVKLLSLHPELWSDAGELMERISRSTSPWVRYQWLLEFASHLEPSWMPYFIQAATPNAVDRASDREWIANAISLLNAQQAGGFLRAAASRSEIPPQTLTPLLRKLGWQGNTEVLPELVVADGDRHQQIDWLIAYADGMVERGLAWDTLTSRCSGWSEENSHVLQSFNESQRKQVMDSALAISLRLAALQRLGLERTSETHAICHQLIQSETNELFTASLRILNQLNDPAIGQFVVSKLVELPPRTAVAAISQLIDSPQWTPALMDALEQGQIPWGLVDPVSMSRLERSSDADTVRRFKELLAKRPRVDRDALVQDYIAALAEKGDLNSGKAVFAKQCASCHRIGDTGFAVGPDISDMRTQSPQQILVSILDPNKAIDANFYRYVALTESGQVLEGLLEDSNSVSLTLRGQEGVRRTIAKEHIEELRATGVSMMPEGFENQINPTAMRDLITYLKRWRLLESAIPIND